MTLVHPSAVVFDNVHIGRGVSIGPNSIVGKQYRSVTNDAYGQTGQTRIGPGCELGGLVVIGKGTRLGGGCCIEDGVTIEVDVEIGPRAHLLYRAYVCNEARIGRETIVGGFVCERAVIGQHSRVFGNLVHQQSDPTAGWDDVDEQSPHIGAVSFIGFGATIIGPVRVGPRSYVCAGALITKDVPPKHIAFGVNQVVHHAHWRGELSRSPLFTGASRGC